MCCWEVSINDKFIVEFECCFFWDVFGDCLLDYFGLINILE